MARGPQKERGRDREERDSEFSDKLVHINRVAKVVKGGKRFGFAALVVVGDLKGRVGFGHGKAREVPEAIRKATEGAKRNLLRVPLRDARTLHHDSVGRHGSGKVVLRSAPAGTGIIAGGAMRAVFEMLGVHDVVAKLARRAGIPKLTPHDFRRTVIGDLLEHVDLATVARVVGHSNPATTASYDRRPERTRRRAFELLHVIARRVVFGIEMQHAAELEQRVVDLAEAHVLEVQALVHVAREALLAPTVTDRLRIERVVAQQVLAAQQPELLDHRFELLARLRALVRRGTAERPTVLEVGALRLDPATRQVWRGEAEIELSAKEFTLLEVFMRNPGHVLSRIQLLEHAWEYDFEHRSNVIEVYMRYLRRKIDQPFGVKSLETVRGAGYRLRRDGGS